MRDTISRKKQAAYKLSASVTWDDLAKARTWDNEPVVRTKPIDMPREYRLVMQKCHEKGQKIN